MATVELDGAPQTNDEFTLADDGQTHIVRTVLGEKVKSDETKKKLKPLTNHTRALVDS